MNKEIPAAALEQILELVIDGKSQREIEVETKYSRVFVRKALKHPDIQGMIKRDTRLAVSKRVGEAVEMLFKLVKKENMDAVKTVFKIVGAMDPEAVLANKTDQQLTIILPGARQEPKTFVSPMIEVEDGSDPSSN